MSELITIELARLVESSTDWERRFKRYDQLQDAGLSCEEAAQIVCADLPEINRRTALKSNTELERNAA